MRYNCLDVVSWVLTGFFPGIRRSSMMYGRPREMERKKLRHGCSLISGAVRSQMEDNISDLRCGEIQREGRD